MANELNSASLAPDEGAILPRISGAERGYTGLRRSGKQIIEEANREFQFPAFLKVVDEMRNNPTVAAALAVYRMMLGRVEWSVEPPIGATEQQKERAKFVASCMTDMDDSWSSFINETISYLEYGFAVHEIVPRRRLQRNGSKHNDGLVGLRKLPPRSQSTISGWNYAEDGRTVESITQSFANSTNALNYSMLTRNGTEVELPRNKVLLFRADATRDNPEGRSILKGCYLAYKQLEIIQDQELIGIARDLGGIPVLGIPPKYMDANASPDEKAVYQAFLDLADNLTTGSQRSAVIPQMFDPETKMPIFSLNLLESKGGARFDTSKIIQRLQNDILTALSCDIIKLGGNSGDSFALADAKTNLLSLSLAYRLKEIAEVLNSELIPWLFKANGWTDTELPKFVSGDFDQMDFETLSKGLQRLKAVGLVETRRDVLNVVREQIGLQGLPDDEPPNLEELSTDGTSSRTGDSFSTPTGGLNGTANSVANNDTSTMNTENAA